MILRSFLLLSLLQLTLHSVEPKRPSLQVKIQETTQETLKEDSLESEENEPEEENSESLAQQSQRPQVIQIPAKPSSIH